MKQSARKPRSLSLVPSPVDEPAAQQDNNASSLKDYFDGWLDSVVPEVMRTAALIEKRASEKSFAGRPLTSTDITRVNRATVRESNDHRHWPPDVVEKFIVADVIKRKRNQ